MSARNSEIVSSAMIVQSACSWIGTPYLHQSSVKFVGCDCLGLVRGVWRETLGNEPCATPQYSADWGEVGSRETLLDVANKYFTKSSETHPEVADLILFRWHENTIIKHLGIMSGPGRFIHAYEKTGVIESPLVSSWSRRVAAIYSFPKVRK